MDHHDRTTSDIEADAFFAQFNDAAPDVIARVRTEGSGDLIAIVAEDQAFGYWARKMAARAERRAAREAAEQAERARIAAASPHLTQPRPSARRIPAPVERVTLPAPRIVTLTTAERADTRRWWHRLEHEPAARGLVRRIRTESRTSEQQQRRAARAHAAWQAEQRAFERAQWHAVVANRNSRPARKKANQWIAIDEDRALAIAIAALDKRTPPQGRK